MLSVDRINTLILTFITIFIYLFSSHYTQRYYLSIASWPNLAFDLCGVFCGHYLMSFWGFFLATFVGKAIIRRWSVCVCVVRFFLACHWFWMDGVVTSQVLIVWFSICVWSTLATRRRPWGSRSRSWQGLGDPWGGKKGPSLIFFWIVTRVCILARARGQLSKKSLPLSRGVPK